MADAGSIYIALAPKKEISKSRFYSPYHPAPPTPLIISDPALVSAMKKLCAEGGRKIAITGAGG